LSLFFVIILSLFSVLHEAHAVCPPYRVPAALFWVTDDSVYARRQILFYLLPDVAAEPPYLFCQVSFCLFGHSAPPLLTRLAVTAQDLFLLLSPPTSGLADTAIFPFPFLGLLSYFLSVFFAGKCVCFSGALFPLVSSGGLRFLILRFWSFHSPLRKPHPHSLSHPLPSFLFLRRRSSNCTPYRSSPLWFNIFFSFT